MGPLRFELRSEDPQSPRMARLPYGPALIVYDEIPYVSCCIEHEKCSISRSDIAPFELLKSRYEVFELRIVDHDLAMNRVNFVEQLPDPHIHQIHDKLLDYDNNAKQHQQVSFVTHFTS